MSSSRVDYDSIAATYDNRYERSAMGDVGTALQALCVELDAPRVLEVGCGTGHWLALLREHVAWQCGLDFSAGMLAQAQAREVTLPLVQGRGGQLPFAEASFDLVFCVNALHHFTYQAQFVAEARRLLKPGGLLGIIGHDPHGERDRWYVYDYFEGVYARDLQRFPTWGQVVGWLITAGCDPLMLHVVERIQDTKIGRAVFDDPFLAKENTSQLALLSADAYAAGLARMKRALAVAEARGETMTFPVDLRLRLLWGRVPE